MIRKASFDDLPVIQELLQQILKLHHDFRPDLYKEIGTKHSAEELKEKMVSGELQVFVKIVGGLVVAHLMCQIIENIETLNSYPYKTLYVDDLCVDSTYQHQGIGEELINFAKKLAKENGCYNLTLHVNASNKNAISFYEHVGLKATSYTMEEIL